MRSRAIYLLLFLSILALAGCGSSARASLAPPLVFPTTATGPSGPPPPSIYVSAIEPQGGTIYALNAQTGGQRWHYQFKANTGYPYLDSGVVYVGASDGKVYALDAGSGSPKWNHTIGGFPSIIGIMNGVIYAGTTSFTPTGRSTQPGAVYALTASDGSIKWQSRVQGFVADMDNDAIYLTTPDSKLDALNISDGSLQWHFQGENPLSTIQIANGQVYIILSPNQGGGQHSIFYALSASDGSMQWRYPSGTGDTALGAFVVDANTVYLEGNPATGLFVYTANTVFAFHAKDGSPLWQTTLQGTALNTAYLDSGTLYTSSGGGKVYALNTQDGSQLWQAQTGNGYPVIEAIDNGQVYASAYGDGLYALSAKDGSVRWRYQSDAFVAVFSITNGVVYAASSGSQNPSEHSMILSLNIANGAALWHYDAGTASITMNIG